MQSEGRRIAPTTCLIDGTRGHPREQLSVHPTMH